MASGWESNPGSHLLITLCPQAASTTKIPSCRVPSMKIKMKNNDVESMSLLINAN